METIRQLRLRHARTAEPGATTRAVGLLAAGYALVGTLWILLSDGAIEAISTEPAWLQTAQRYKGLAYVLVTTLALVVLARLAITRLLAAQRLALESELRVQDLFMNHPVPMWVQARDGGRVLRANAAAAAAYGHPAAAMTALHAQDLLAPADLPAFRAATREAGSPQATTRVLQHRRRDGGGFIARTTVAEVVFDGRPSVMVTAEDVTAEVELQRAMKRQQAQFRQLHESLGEVLWMASPDGRQMHYVSPAFEQLYGRSLEALMARPQLWQDAVHPDDRDRPADIGAPTAHAGADDDLAVRQYRIVRPDGSVRWIEDRKRPIRDETGAVVMIGGIAEDITARVERDETQAQLQGRLEALVAERTRELEQTNLELEAFSRTAAHDLKTPLNGIVGMAQLLRLNHGEALGPRGSAYAAQIERCAHDMGSLINDLLAFSRAGSVELHWADVDLVPVIHAVLADLRAQDPQRVVQIEHPPRMLLRCDQGLMRSVLQNLLGNAWKFSARVEAPHILVDLRQVPRGTEISVCDNGPGFDASAMPEVFRPFQRFHTQTQFQGTGLGLVTCQRIVQRHGGTLRIQSAPGRGTTATINLPPATAA